MKVCPSSEYNLFHDRPVSTRFWRPNPVSALFRRLPSLVHLAIAPKIPDNGLFGG